MQLNKLISTIIRRSILFASFAACTATISLADMEQLESQPSGDTAKVSRQRIGTILQGPDGLATLAKLEQHFVMEREIRPWSNVDLATLTDSAGIIVIGKIVARSSSLIDQGDDIQTEYTIVVNSVLKGRVPGGKLTFVTQGGKVDFPNGTTAEIKSVEWEQLQIGQKYLIFLSIGPDNAYRPANGVEALFKISTAGQVDALAAHDSSVHRITEDVKNISATALIGKVQSAVSKP